MAAPVRACSVLFLLASLASCTPEALPSSPLTGASPAVGWMERAAERHGVPAGYLAAIAYIETRFQMRVGEEPSMRGGHGMLHLVEGETLARAAALTGVDEPTLRTDRAAHIDGAAAVLAALRDETGSWEAALARYGPGSYDEDAGRRYVEAIETLVYEGVAGTDDAGRSIVLRPSGGDPPELAWTGDEGDDVGVVRAAARPDYGGARWVGPACEYTRASRGPAQIDYIVIHTCQGGFSGCWSWLRSCGGATASVHYVVSSGGEIVQVVEEKDIAYHDGCFNSNTIGIEHEGFISDPGRWYTEAMYCASARLTRSICDRNGIPCNRQRVIGHVEAPDCSDHTDPGPGWNWTKYMEYVRCGCGGCCTPGRSESCNGADDDCDGRIDEGLQRRCGSDVGACRRGTQTCRAGSWGGCVGEIRPRGEGCNGVDDDCDGQVDESLRRGCGTDVGECERGEQVCRAGDWGSCEGGVEPVPERCDRLDNDCDGLVDDEDVCAIEELVMQGQLALDHTDVDGDGKSDACACNAGQLECHRATGHGFEQAFPGPTFDPEGFEDPSRFSTLRMGDIDGDGRADACLRVVEGVRCWTAGGRRFGVEIEGPPLSDADGFDRAPYFTTIRLADVDGDGKADLCARWPDGLRCYRSTGRGFDEVWHLPDLADDAGFEAVEHYGTLRMGDIDGDGRVDVCARRSDGVVCWRSSGHGFTSELLLGPAWTDAAGFDALDVWSTIRLTDVDGDGKADLCARTPTGFECHPASARGFGDPYLGPALASADGWADKSQYSTLRMGDVDGDGRADLCGRTRAGIACWLFTGRGFGARIDGPSLGDDMGWKEPSWFRTIRLADVTGDGRADLCARDDGGARCWRSDGRGFPIELAGPGWADGWDAPHRFGTIRIEGGGHLEAAPLDPPAEEGPDLGCRCSAPGARRDLPIWGITALCPFSILLASRGRRRRSSEVQR